MSHRSHWDGPSGDGLDVHGVVSGTAPVSVCFPPFDLSRGLALNDSFTVASLQRRISLMSKLSAVLGIDCDSVRSTGYVFILIVIGLLIVARSLPVVTSFMADVLLLLFSCFVGLWSLSYMFLVSYSFLDLSLLLCLSRFWGVFPLLSWGRALVLALFGGLGPHCFASLGRFSLGCFFIFLALELPGSCLSFSFGSMTLVYTLSFLGCW